SGIVVKSNVQLNYKINIADLDEGIYFVQIKSIKGFIFKKLVIVR
ncbi:MAG TPA: T9SS type A sorting domain-containing protein, partial [Bacteroidetes bacterium]|nr:T9SS type A sorting domain-containing protein [Bacteroidota bacterium]